MIESLKSFLPPDYGEVLTELRGPHRAKIGIVMPIYGRASYLKRALNSLAASDLTDAVVCLVDETNASDALGLVEGFTSFNGVDSPGHTNAVFLGDRNLAASRALADETCLAFTSAGQLKTRIALLLRKAPGLTLYVRNEQLRLRPFLRTRLNYLSRNGPDHQTENIVRQWSVPGVPIVKIIKNRHGNMFDSYKHGFELLAQAFACEYFVCLDSDTLVKPHWLDQLLVLHKRFSSPERPLLVSGFHTNSHETLVEGQDHRQKKTMGGVNLLFNREIWQEWVQPSLTSLNWDRQLGKDIVAANGRLLSSKPSVVAHIGRQGVWSSWLNFDKATDF